LYLTLRDTRKFPIFVQGDQLNLFGGKLEYIGRF